MDFLRRNKCALCAKQVAFQSKRDSPNSRLRLGKPGTEMKIQPLIDHFYHYDTLDADEVDEV